MDESLNVVEHEMVVATMEKSLKEMSMVDTKGVTP